MTTCGLILAWLLGFGLLPQSEAAPPQQVLILMDERTVLGRFERQADGSARRLDGAGTTVFPKAQVARICSSAEEAYLTLRSRANLRDAHERCRLAEWCLRHGLANFARVEAEAAVELMPQLADAKLLLSRAMQAEKQARTPASSTPSDAVRQASATGSDQTDAAVQPASASLTEIDQRGLSVTASGPSFLGWEQLLQPTELQDFTRTIQPVLINGCGTGACHGNEAHRQAGFYLLRGFDGNVPAPYTRANLAQTLKLVNKNDPRNSPLLLRAVQPHGGSSRMPFGQADAPAVTVLQRWVQRIAPERMAERPDEPFTPPPREPKAPVAFATGTGAGSGTTAIAAPLPGGPKGQSESGAPPGDGPSAPSPSPTSTPDSGPSTGGGRAMPPLMSLRGQPVSKVRPAGSLARSLPAETELRAEPVAESDDPFDPMVFNRAQHPNRQP